MRPVRERAAVCGGVKSNLLSDAIADVNLGFEIGLAPRWSFEVTADYMGWNIPDNRRRKHFILQPEIRYWFCDRFIGHHIGVHALGGKFNFGMIPGGLDLLGTDFGKLRDRRYQGYSIGGGIAYGYDFVLSRHWNLETEIGAGYVYSVFDEYMCTGCGRKTAEDLSHGYWGITKTVVALVYYF